MRTASGWGLGCQEHGFVGLSAFELPRLRKFTVWVMGIKPHISSSELLSNGPCTKPACTRNGHQAFDRSLILRRKTEMCLLRPHDVLSVSLNRLQSQSSFRHQAERHVQVPCCIVGQFLLLLPFQLLASQGKL